MVDKHKFVANIPKVLTFRMFSCCHPENGNYVRLILATSNPMIVMSTIGDIQPKLDNVIPQGTNQKWVGLIVGTGRDPSLRCLSEL